MLALAVILSCCTDDGQDSATPGFAIEPRSTVLEAAGGSVWVSVEAPGDWTVRIVFDSDSEWAAVSPASGTGDMANMLLTYEANTADGSRKLALVLQGTGGSARTTVTQKGVSGISAVDFSNGSDVAQFDWLELPATKAGDGLTFFVHDMEGGKFESEAVSGPRNWSFYWDAAEHLSLWVAYPLNANLHGRGSRSNAWALDPLLPASAQPNLVNGSYGGGWTRGHQLPSADRLTSYKTNASTFYGTNMTPQQYDFNGEIWARLESKVRSYSDMADTLYVVTGCLYKDSKLLSGNNSGFEVKIPTHYFKALLYRGKSTYASANGFMAAGFLLPHDASIRGGDFLDYIMSIDELEARTGIDFFPNLVGIIGQAKADALEAEEPSKWWK